MSSDRLIGVGFMLVAVIFALFMRSEATLSSKIRQEVKATEELNMKTTQDLQFKLEDINVKIRSLQDEDDTIKTGVSVVSYQTDVLAELIKQYEVKQ